MRHPYFGEEQPVFDNTSCGRALQAERQDEPGMELEGYGDAALLEEDLHGDWSWKPNRNKRYGIELRALAAPMHAIRRGGGSEPGALFFGGLTDESAADFQGRAIAAHEASGDRRRVSASGTTANAA